MDRSPSSRVATAIDPTHRQPSHDHLVTFNTISQQYGDFFAGFPWTLYGCGTYKKKTPIDLAHSLMKRYMRELSESISSPVAYLAVPERRTSGCGFHPIPLHWHFLAACPSHLTTDFLRNATQLWTSGSGNASVSRYDPSRSGAYYVAKLAADQDFDFSSDHLDRLSCHGPKDLFKAAMNNPYVPAHAQGEIRCNTLVVRNSVTKLPTNSR